MASAVASTLALVGALTGCTPASTSTPRNPAATASASALPTQSTGSPQDTATTGPASPPTASPAVVDLTQPGAARDLVRQLIAASGSSQVLMVTIRKREASVSVLKDGRPHTWAYRDGAIREVSSDLAYVDQVTFDPGTFDLSDVGALFRAAAAVSGSDDSQELQIVDLRRVEHSALEMKMSVATNPETRTVFFNPDGSLVPTLDFNALSGITGGLDDAIGSHTDATSVTVSSAGGAVIEYPGDGSTTVRRMRTARVPVTDVPRSGADKLPTFNPRLVTAATVWRVLQRSAASGAFTATTTWSVVADCRGGLTTPRLHFVVGTARSTTDLQGNEVTP